MSRAFVTDGDEPWLDEIPPTMSALINFLTRENNGVPVYEKRNFRDEQGNQVVEMSNGLSYSKDSNGKWKVL